MSYARRHRSSAWAVYTLVLQFRGRQGWARSLGLMLRLLQRLELLADNLR